MKNDMVAQLRSSNETLEDKINELRCKVSQMKNCEVKVKLKFECC